MANEFINDSVIYYNLPLTSDQDAKNKKACTFPRNEIPPEDSSRRVSSCPGSPTLRNPKVKAPLTSIAPDPPKVSEKTTGSKKSKRALTSYKSFDLENFYCSIRKAASNSRRKSCSWWKKKTTSLDRPPENKLQPSKEAQDVDKAAFTLNYLDLKFPSGSGSSATTADDDEYSDNFDGTYIQVCGGTSYIKPETKLDEVLKPIPVLLDYVKHESENSMCDLVSEWHRKARWLNKVKKDGKSKMAGLKIPHNSGNCVHISTSLHMYNRRLLSGQLSDPVPSKQMLDNVINDRNWFPSQPVTGIRENRPASECTMSSRTKIASLRLKKSNETYACPDTFTSSSSSGTLSMSSSNCSFDEIPPPLPAKKTNTKKEPTGDA